MHLRHSLLLHGASAAIVAGLVTVAVSGPLLLGLLVIAAAAGVAVLAAAGAYRVGLALLCGAYLTAPFYKGVAIGGVSSPVTATDLLLFGGLVLLLPRILRGRVRLPAVYGTGIAVVTATGLIASALSDGPVISFLSLAFWLAVLLGLPLALALWGPGPRIVDLLATSYVLGQVVSLAGGIVQGNVGAGRHAGLATHPNYLAQAGLLSLCLLLYLAHRHLGRSVLLTTAIAVAVAICAASIWMSSSRAGVVVVAGLVVLVPIVERSAALGFVWASLGALAIFALPYVVAVSADDSPIGRLLGGSGSSNSDAARTLGLEEGLDRFWGAPLTGTGLIDLFDIHNNFVEVLVAVGIFGFVGYLMVLAPFAAALFGSHPQRRLCYAVWVYLAFGLTVPSLYDRSVWAVVALGVLAFAVPDARPTRAHPPRSSSVNTPTPTPTPTPAGSSS